MYHCTTPLYPIDASPNNRLQHHASKCTIIFFPVRCNFPSFLASNGQNKHSNLKRCIIMMDFISIPLVVGIICAGIYGLFELFVRRKERLAIIEKISNNLDASAFEGKLGLPNYMSRFSFSALKVGCLLAGIGLGLLVGFFINLSLRNMYYQEHQFTEMAFSSSVLLFGGIGLIVAFVIELKLNKDKKA